MHWKKGWQMKVCFYLFNRRDVFSLTHTLLAVMQKLAVGGEILSSDQAVEGNRQFRIVTELLLGESRDRITMCSKIKIVSRYNMKKLTTAKIWQFAAGQFGWAMLSGIISNWLVYFYQPDKTAISRDRRCLFHRDW